MEWTRRRIVGSIIILIVIFNVVVIYRIIHKTSQNTSPTAAPGTVTATPQGQQYLLSLGADYEVVGDITTSGMFIGWDLVNDMLKEHNINREELWKHFYNKGRLPQELDKEIRQMINPSFLESENTYNMYVNFDIVVDDTTLKIRVNTTGYDKTLAYYFAVEQGRRVMFQQGEPAPVSAMRDTDTFPSSKASISGNCVVGTPFNFVPLFPRETDALPKQ